MGCSQSSEAAVQSGTNPNNEASQQKPPAPSTSTPAAPKETASATPNGTAREIQTSAQAKDAATASTAATITTNATKKADNDAESSNEEMASKGSAGTPPDEPAAKPGAQGGSSLPPRSPASKNMENAPVIRQVPTKDGPPVSPSSRDRFASYASGASTPNSSSGDISGAWGDDITGGGGDDASTGSSGRSSKPRRTNKTLKHSGSAIGLDEILNDTDGNLTAKVVHIEVPFGRPIEEVYDGVHDGPVLGSGVSGLVRLVEHKATGVKYAVKCLDLGLVGSKEGLAQLREEIFIMCQLDHPNIVRLEEVYESHSEIYLVQELCLGGELFDRLDEQPDYHYTESECARLVKQMLSAVRYLHSKGIIHRDLKLENFLFSSTAADSELKMIDFGLSKHFRFGEVHHEAVGTPYTVAPEVIRGNYDERCDIWAIGVITFLLLSGDPPFGGCGGPEPLMTVRSNILRGAFEFEPQDIWSLVSERAREFIRAMLVTDPQKRPTARDSQKHLWLREWAHRARTETDAALNSNVVKALVAFKEFSDMRKLLSEVLSFTLLPDQIKDLRKEFEKIDTDGSGEISLTALKQVLLDNAGAGSLGALTESEVEDIFNAMRVNKSETRIHWHEFVAAGLSQCRVDDRNLRLAFDRLDSNHKGYITLDDIMDLVGTNDMQNEESTRKMWQESMKAVNCIQARITYDDFLLLMKGQERKAPRRKSFEQSTLAAALAMPLPNSEISSTGSLTPKPDPTLQDSTKGEVMQLHPLPNLQPQDETKAAVPSPIMSSPRRASSASPPGRKMIAEVLPVPEHEEAKGLDVTLTPTFPSRPAGADLGGRKRSLSLTDKDMDTRTISDDLMPKFGYDARRALAITEVAPGAPKSALAANKQLYRAHRQMRLAVLEASRRFEEKQVHRARDVLIAQKEAESAIQGAGLVMRHGTRAQVTSDAIRGYLQKTQQEQQQLVEKSSRRGGRGRSARKKTVSDMSEMMSGSLGQDELSLITAKIGSVTPKTDKSIFQQSTGNIGLPELTEGQVASAPPMPVLSSHVSIPEVKVVDRPDIRKATVPGNFQKTQDPFSSVGLYGAARLDTVAKITGELPSDSATPQE